MERRGRAAVAVIAVAGALAACGGSESPTLAPAATGGGAPCPAGLLPRLEVPADRILLHAYTDALGATVPFFRMVYRAYVEQAGKGAAIAVPPAPLETWDTSGFVFPAERARLVWELGAVPELSPSPLTITQSIVEPAERPADPSDYLLQRIVDGEFDEGIRAWARAARDSGLPIFAGLFGEVTAGWPWSGHTNGAGKKDGYGDPAYPDGPERFRDAFRHIVTLAREEGARNVSWVFGATGDDPTLWWNRAAYYYPGDDYVDWLAGGVWGYYPPYVPTWTPFPQGMDAIYESLTALSDTKPLAIELGVATNPQERAEERRKAAWIEEAYRTLAEGRWPRVKAIRWWNEHSSLELGGGVRLMTDIGSSPEVTAAFRAGIASPVFLGEAPISCYPAEAS